jgi:hypothetical protein
LGNKSLRTQLQKTIIFITIFLNLKINFFVNKTQKHIGFFI